MSRSIATPPRPGWNPSPWQGYPQQHVASTHLSTWVKRGPRWGKICCLWKPRDGQGLKRGPADRELEVLTARQHTPPHIYKGITLEVMYMPSRRESST